jgi:hypothetical protein
MSKVDLSAKLAAEYEKSVTVHDERQFEVCTVKQIEEGLISKRYVFVHFDGKGFNILTTDVRQRRVTASYYRLH